MRFMIKKHITTITFISLVVAQLFFIYYNPAIAQYFNLSGTVILVFMLAVTLSGIVGSAFNTTRDKKKLEDKQRKFVLSNRGRLYVD
jgi:hypothetical protein